VFVLSDHARRARAAFAAGLRGLRDGHVTALGGLASGLLRHAANQHERKRDRSADDVTTT